MQPVIGPVRRPVRGEAGFTTLEALIAVALLAILLAMGMPSMSNWLGASAAANTSQFYAEGFRLAKSQALANNSRSRLVLSDNAQSGQLDWQVDVCFVSADDQCAADSVRWSDVNEAAATPATVAINTVSVLRSSASLPSPSKVSVTPDGAARSVYFTELGWVDAGKPALTRLDIEPGNVEQGGGAAFPASAVVLTLAGTVVVCRPDLAAGESRSCP